MNREQAAEFTKRLITMLMFYMEPIFAPDGQIERVLEHMQQSHTDQWQIIRENEKWRCEFDTDYCHDEDRYFYPDFI